MADDISGAEVRRMMMKTETESFVLGVFVGALIGGGIALLYAPAKGSETRQMIKEKAQETEKTIEETLADLKEKVEALATTVAEKAKELKAQTAKE